MSSVISPANHQDVAAALAEAGAEGGTVRIAGAGTKLGWGAAVAGDILRLSTAGLRGTITHNAGDLTATFEAGTPLADVQSQLSAHGQMLALDPPGALDGRSPTLGGIFASGDAGPMQHRYGAPRDLILGITVALADGSIARAGGAVIKNVAGYDLPRLFTGAMGSLGVILALSVRLHPRPVSYATVLGSAPDADRLCEAIAVLNRSALELDALDFGWREGLGGVLARCGGTDAAGRAADVAETMSRAGFEDVEIREQDEPLWGRQRAGQRSSDRAIVRVSAARSALRTVLRLADDCGATAVGRAGLGISYLTVNVNRIAAIRAGLPPGASAIVRDLPISARGAVDLWGPLTGPEHQLMRAVKHEFDPLGVCNPGVFGPGL